MTKVERDALRALEAKATPGPWESAEQSGGDEWAIIGRGGTNPGYPLEGLVVATWCDEADGGLISAARNSMRALLDALDDAEAVIEAARRHQRLIFGWNSLSEAIDAYDAKHGGGG